MWRSLLFVPVLEDRFIAKAAERGASAVVLDLEASVAADRKVEAREKLPNIVKELAPKVEVTVRINSLWLGAIRDLEACVILGVSALHLAQCESAEYVKAIDGLVTELEAERGLVIGSISLVAILESPRAVLNAQAIAAASPRLVGLALGVEDYATAMEGDTVAALLEPAGFHVIQAARAEGLTPLVVPTSMAGYRNLDVLEAAAKRARSQGSTGSYAVHPKQIEVLNRTFAPTESELDWARRVLTRAESATKAREAVFQIDGRMIDLPLITRARNILRNAPENALPK